MKSQTLLNARQQENGNAILLSLLIDDALTMYFEIAILFRNFQFLVQTNLDHQQHYLKIVLQALSC